MSGREPDRPGEPGVGAPATRPRALFVGVGNPYRGDDAAGLLVARRLRETCPADIRVVEASGEAADLLVVWEGADDVVLVDAVAAAAPPGTVFRFEVGVDPLPPAYARRSTHAVGVGEAIALAGALDRLPSRLVVYGIVGRCFDVGEEVSPAVEAVLDDVADRALTEVGSPSLAARSWRDRGGGSRLVGPS